MVSGWLNKTYVTLLLIVLGGIVLHAPLSVYLSVVWPEYALIIKSWKEVLLLVSAGLAVVLVSRHNLWRRLIDDWLVKLIVAYALLHVLLLFAFDTGVLSSLAGLMIDLRYVLYFGLVYIAAIINPGLRRPFMRVGIIGAVLVVGFGLLQITVLPDDILKHLGYSRDTIAPYITIDQNPDYVRINSTMRGPNPLGAYGVVLLAVTAAVLLKRKLPDGARWRWLAGSMLAGGMAVTWASYSRSALVAAITALLLVLITTLGVKWSRRTWIVSLGVVGALAGGLLLVARDSAFVQNVILHENPESSSVSKSNEEHLDSLIDGTSRMARQPLGAGIGSTGSASLYGDKGLIIENQYLFIAHEVGWLGLGLFVAIFGLILWRLWLGRADYLALGLVASGIGLSMIGLLLPVWADDTVSLIWWGLAGLVLGLLRGEESKGKESSNE